MARLSGVRCVRFPAWDFLIVFIALLIISESVLYLCGCAIIIYNTCGTVNISVEETHAD